MVFSFLKQGKPNTNVTSYRPIALTSCTEKLLEKIGNVRLVNELKINKSLSLM